MLENVAWEPRMPSGIGDEGAMVLKWVPSAQLCGEVTRKKKGKIQGHLGDIPISDLRQGFQQNSPYGTHYFLFPQSLFHWACFLSPST